MPSVEANGIGGDTLYHPAKERNNDTVITAKIIGIYGEIRDAMQCESLPFHSKVDLCKEGCFKKLCDIAKTFPGFQLEEEKKRSTEDFVHSLIQYIVDCTEEKRSECLQELHKIKQIIQGDHPSKEEEIARKRLPSPIRELPPSA